MASPTWRRSPGAKCGSPMRVAPPGALLASNTSSLSIGQIAAAMTQPARLIGMHFFNPVHVMKLVEVVTHGRDTLPAADRAVQFARMLGKEPIVVSDSPGFASSRLGIVLGLEAMRMLEQDVASAEDIDKAMELGYNHPMGPLKLTDLVGLDVRLAIAEYLHRTLEEPQFEPPRILRDKEQYWDFLTAVMDDPRALLEIMDGAGVWRVGLVNYPAPDVMGFTVTTN